MVMVAPMSPPQSFASRNPEEYVKWSKVGSSGSCTIEGKEPWALELTFPGLTVTSS